MNYFDDKLKEDDVVFAVSVSDVQFKAEKLVGRKLNYEEMYSIKKGIEWGLEFWDEIVGHAIRELRISKLDK